MSVLSSSALSADKSMVFAGCESEAYKIIGIQTDQTATQDYLDKKSEAIRVCMVRQGFQLNRDYFYSSAVEVSQTMHGYTGPKQSVSKTQRNDYVCGSAADCAAVSAIW